MDPTPLEVFRVWASDHVLSAPIDVARLVQWARAGRIASKTWVYLQDRDQWQRAETIEALRSVFVDSPSAHVRNSSSLPMHSIRAEELRQFGAFSRLTEDQLNRFIEFGELVEAPQGRIVLKSQDPSDSLFLVLSGEVRARLMVGSEEKTLGRMRAGECFGEVAMFTQTRRSADVVAETNTRLLRFTSESCLEIVRRYPEIAAPVLFNIATMMASRLAERNQQVQRDTTA